MRVCRRRIAFSRAAGRTFIWKVRRPTLASSTDIFWLQKLRMPLRPSSFSTRTPASATGNSFARPRARCCGRTSMPEYQQELQGIADGVKAHGVDLDVYDIVALNAFEEVPDYYVPWLNKRDNRRPNPTKPECAGKLQRFHRHRRLHERSSDCDRAQQLDELSGGRAMGG